MSVLIEKVSQLTDALLWTTEDIHRLSERIGELEKASSGQPRGHSKRRSSSRRRYSPSPEKRRKRSRSPSYDRRRSPPVVARGHQKSGAREKRFYSHLQSVHVNNLKSLGARDDSDCRTRIKAMLGVYGEIEDIFIGNNGLWARVSYTSEEAANRCVNDFDNATITVQKQLAPKGDAAGRPFSSGPSAFP